MSHARAHPPKSPSRALAAVLALASILTACSNSNGAGPTRDAGALDAGTDGAASLWSVVGPGGSATLRAIWGSSASDVYAVGYRPETIVHSGDDGQTWPAVTLDSANDPLTMLTGVGGSGPGDVYVVGNLYYQPIVLHSSDRGVTWQTTKLPFVGLVYGVWSSGPSDTYVVGSDDALGAVIARTSDQGGTWTITKVGAAGGLSSVWGSGPNDVYLVGSQAAPSSANDGGVGLGDAGADLGRDAAPDDAGTDSGSVPTEGVVFHSTDGGQTWTVVTTTPGALFSVAGTSDGSRIDAVGEGFTVVESTDHGATWTLVSSGGGDQDSSQLTSVWLSEPNADPYIASSEGILRNYVEGSGPSSVDWNGETLPGDSPIAEAVWGTGDDDVYAVGVGGLIARRR